MIPDELDPKVVEVYQGVGKVLSRYTSGKVSESWGALWGGVGAGRLCCGLLFTGCELPACLPAAALAGIGCTLLAWPHGCTPLADDE